MIGKFRIIDIGNGEEFVLAESMMNNSFKGKFYIPPLYRTSCSNLKKGDEVFGVLDDQTGFGAILFKFDDKMTDGYSLTLTQNLRINKSLMVDEDASVGGSETVQKDVIVYGNTDIAGNTNIGGNITTGGICAATSYLGGPTMSTLLIDSSDCAAIVAGATLSPGIWVPIKSALITFVGGA